MYLKCGCTATGGGQANGLQVRGRMHRDGLAGLPAGETDDRVLAVGGAIQDEPPIASRPAAHPARWRSGRPVRLPALATHRKLPDEKMYCKYNLYLNPLRAFPMLGPMRLSVYSDFALRVLMQAALCRPDRVTVDEVAETFGISRHHLVKVVHDLGRNGFLQTRRGVGGGFTLGRLPDQIRIGEVVRLGEKSETVIDCQDRQSRPCRLLPACRLKGVLDEAASAFFEVLDNYTIADLVKQPAKMREVLQL